MSHFSGQEAQCGQLLILAQRLLDLENLFVKPGLANGDGGELGESADAPE